MKAVPPEIDHNNHRYRELMMQSDLEREAARRVWERGAAQYAIDRLGELLDAADSSLTQLLDDNDTSQLGTAIVRACQELADAVGGLASQIEDQSDEDRRALAQACIDDAQQTLLLMEEGVAGRNHNLTTTTVGVADANSAASPVMDVAQQQHQQRLAELSSDLSQDQVMGAIQAAGTLLRDVEATLRAVDRHDAEEIADAALTLAHLFVVSLQSIHESLTPDDLVPGAPYTSRGSSTAPTIELLGEDEGGDNDDDGVFENVRGVSDRRLGRSDAASTATAADATSKSRRQRMERLRVLWPPLGPAVAGALQWGQQTAMQKPILAVALGITLWPAATVAAVVGTPLVVLDGLIQNLYQNFQDGPIVQGMERSAAQLYQTGRLSLLCGKLVGRQAWRVACRQVERHGGVGHLAGEVGGFCLDRATHPVETATMAWNGITWGWSKAMDTWSRMCDREREDTVQRLQQ